MKNLEGMFDFTKEALFIGESFFRNLRNEGERQNIVPSTLQEICDSLEEHLGFALHQELDKRRLTVVDAQVMAELIVSLGTPEELLEGLPTVDSVQSETAKNMPLVEFKKDEKRETNKEEKKEIPPDFRARFRRKPLCRSTKNRWLFGVCGGFAEFFGVPPILIRVLFIFPPFLLPLFFFVYLPLSYLLPTDKGPDKTAHTQKAEGCLLGTVRFVFSILMSLFVFFPLTLASLLMIWVGCLKILSEIGWNIGFMNDSWFYWIMNFPGFVAGGVNVIIGLCFCVVFIHLMIATFFGRALLTINTRKILLSLGILGLVFQGSLLAISKTQTSAKADDLHCFSFPCDQIQEIVFQGKEQNPPLYNRHIEIVGMPGIATVSIEIVREARGRNFADAEEAVHSINADPVLESGKLVLPVALDPSSWWFYRYPELQISIKVPLEQALTLSTEGNFRHGKIFLRKLHGSINLNVETLDMELDEINCPQLKLANKVGSVLLGNIETNILEFSSSVGSIDIRNLKCATCTLETDVGHVELLKVIADSLEARTRVGAINIDGFLGKTLRAKSDVGSVQVKTYEWAPEVEYFLESNIGSVNIRVPENPVPALFLNSQIGKIRNDFDESIPASGAPRIKIETHIGGIRVNSGNKFDKLSRSSKWETTNRFGNSWNYSFGSKSRKTKTFSSNGMPVLPEMPQVPKIPGQQNAVSSFSAPQLPPLPAEAPPKFSKNASEPSSLIGWDLFEKVIQILVKL
ncbi:MAG: PspC domain-containing protein [Candidatus Riflebacteria bacterium]|nr:PspC domain-containing protein [Candidatus Riflebacteria bacterium]